MHRIQDPWSFIPRERRAGDGAFRVLLSAETTCTGRFKTCKPSGKKARITIFSRSRNLYPMIVAKNTEIRKDKLKMVNKYIDSSKYFPQFTRPDFSKRRIKYLLYSPKEYLTARRNIEKFWNTLYKSAMQTRAPVWCEIDRKRLLRHIACCFLLLFPAHPAESHTRCHLSYTLPASRSSSSSSSYPALSTLGAHPNLPYHIISSESHFTFAFPGGAFFLTSNWLLCAYCWKSIYGCRCHSEMLRLRANTQNVVSPSRKSQMSPAKFNDGATKDVRPGGVVRESKMIIKTTQLKKIEH